MAVEWLLSYLALGLMTGFFAGLFGVGGGGIMVPILAMLFTLQGFPSEHVVHLALATSMAAIVPTAIASLRAHHLRGAVNWQAVKRLTPGVLLGTYSATFVAVFLSPKLLAMIFTLFMSYMACKMWWGTPPHPSRQLPNKLLTSVVGVGIGAMSALVAIGGGTMTVPFLVRCNIAMTRAIGTSAAVGFPIALAGAAGYGVNGWQVEGLPSHTVGYIVWPAVLAMASMSSLTAALGARVAHALPIVLLKRSFAGIMVLLAVKMLLTIWD